MLIPKFPAASFNPASIPPGDFSNIEPSLVTSLKVLLALSPDFLISLKSSACFLDAASANGSLPPAIAVAVGAVGFLIPI